MKSAYADTVTLQVAVAFLPPTVIVPVIVQVPAPTGVTVPPDTVATVVFELFQVTVSPVGLVVAVIAAGSAALEAKVSVVLSKLILGVSTESAIQKTTQFSEISLIYCIVAVLLRFV